MVILVAGVISFAQNAKRIDLAKEGPAVIWEERVSANSSKNFVFYLQKGSKSKDRLYRRHPAGINRFR